MCSRKPTSTLAFTVPEMLAVVAIIVIVISILLPAVGKARDRARFVICRSNLHQIAIGSRSYSIDSQHLPTGWTSNYVVWLGEIFWYTPDPDLFYCPTAPSIAKWAGPKWGSGLPAKHGYKADQQRVGIGEYFSYGHNNDGTNAGSHIGVGEGDFGHAKSWIKSASVRAPSSFIMYGDSTVDTLWDHFIDEDYEDGSGRTEYPADRHDQGAHLAFGDGHVEWDLQVRLWILGTQGTVLPELRRRWNNDHEPH